MATGDVTGGKPIGGATGQAVAAGRPSAPGATEASWFDLTPLAAVVRAAANHPDMAGAMAFGLLATAVYLFTSSRDPENLNYFVRLADAFLHGRIYLTENPSWLVELVGSDGRYHVVYPPVPAILIVPFVALFGPEFPQQVASSLFAGIAVGFAWVLFGRFALGTRVRVMLTVVFGFGTVLWWAAETGTAWVTSHDAAVMFSVAALILAFDRRWPFVAGLLLGAATLSRLPVVLTAPLLFALYAELAWPPAIRSLGRPRVRRIVAFGTGLAIFGALYLAYNVARWGTPVDLGYTSIPGVLEDPIYAKHGIFALEYIPRHIYAILFRSWNYVDDPPFFQPSWWGLGLFLTTPVLLWLVRARRRDPRVVYAAVAIGLTLIPIVTHGNVGIAQFGYRFSLGFQAPMFVVLATVFERGMSRAAWVAAAGSVAINAYAIWAIGIGFVAY